MIIGHKKQWQYLKNLAAAQKVPHALLFAGQEALGKKTIALEFAKLLNCSAVNSPCQKCQPCQSIRKSIYPDLRVIHSGDNKEIKISQIRELEQFLSLKPFVGLCKVAVIDDCHLMTLQSQSCLLKTLEEPKGNSFLILIAEHPERLLDTILSRVERLNFYPVGLEVIKAQLCSQRLPANRVEEIVKFSFGRPGRAIDFLEAPEKLKEQTKLFQKIAQLSSLDYVDRFQYAKELAENSSGQLSRILELWLRYFRSHLIEQPEARPRAVKIIKTIERTLFLISTTNVNKKLALEVLMLEL